MIRPSASTKKCGKELAVFTLPQPWLQKGWSYFFLQDILVKNAIAKNAAFLE